MEKLWDVGGGGLEVVCCQGSAMAREACQVCAAGRYRLPDGEEEELVTTLVATVYSHE